MAGLIEKMEEAAGISAPTPKIPYGKGERISGGSTARPWTGPKPWAEKTGSGKTEEPANGGYEHNSPAKPL